jgi:hypothetical protein
MRELFCGLRSTSLGFTSVDWTQRLGEGQGRTGQGRAGQELLPWGHRIRRTVTSVPCTLEADGRWTTIRSVESNQIKSTRWDKSGCPLLQYPLSPSLLSNCLSDNVTTKCCQQLLLIKSNPAQSGSSLLGE